jgi:protein-tyrosine-phosphatase/predicted ATP-grasp superfamily ATP-dependent carboligase
MSVNTGRVLVLGEDTRSFLSVVRSLGRYGLEVHAAWCRVNASAARSKYLHKIHRLPGYCFGDHRWLDGLLATMHEHNFDLVIPCHDAAMLLLQSNRRVLERAGRVYLLDDNAFEISFSKEKSYQLAHDLGVNVPKQAVIHSCDEMFELGREWGYPLVLKPRASATSANPFARQYVQKVWNENEASIALQGFKKEAWIQVQRNFNGRGVGVELLASRGEILVALQHERVHEPLTGGGSSYRKSVPLTPELLSGTSRLMKTLNYTGVAMVEFKVNPENGDWVFIEINGRFWGSLPLALAAGADFPRYLYEMLCLGKEEFSRSYRTGVYCRNWALDWNWFRANLKADHANPHLLTLPLHKVAAEFGNLVTLKERSDTFVLDDLSPAFADLRAEIGSRSRRFIRNTPFMRDQLQRKALRAFQSARSVLFVCKGNICRSPFAHKILQCLRPDIHCVSAGYYPIAGRSSPRLAIETARKFGIDLESHRSSFLTSDMLAQADAVFVFDDENFETLVGDSPECGPKLHYLGALDPMGPLQLADPFGQSGADFDECYRRINALLAKRKGAASAAPV